MAKALETVINSCMGCLEVSRYTTFGFSVVRTAHLGVDRSCYQYADCYSRLAAVNDNCFWLSCSDTWPARFPLAAFVSASVSCAFLSLFLTLGIAAAAVYFILKCSYRYRKR